MGFDILAEALPSERHLAGWPLKWSFFLWGTWDIPKTQNGENPMQFGCQELGIAAYLISYTLGCENPSQESLLHI